MKSFATSNSVSSNIEEVSLDTYLSNVNINGAPTVFGHTNRLRR